MDLQFAWRSFAFLTLVSLALAPSAHAAFNEDQERQHIDKLCDQGLFDAARKYCQQRQADSKLEQHWRSFYAIEESRTLVRQAIATPSADHSLWAEAIRVLEPYSTADSTERVLPQTQAALAQLAHGEYLVGQSKLTGDSANAALTPLRDAVRRFEAVAKLVASQSRERSESRMRPEQLRSLGNQARAHQAEALLRLALLFPADSPDRADALNRAVKLLAPLAALADDQPLAWETRIDLVRCLRLQGDFPAAAKSLAELESGAAPVDIQPRMRAECIRLALAENKLAAALELARRPPPTEGRNSPELDQARLAAVLANCAQADKRGDQQSVQALQTEANTIVTAIRATHAGAWAADAEHQLARVVGSTTNGGSVDVLKQAAETHYRAGRIDDALSVYDRASEQAVAENQLEPAFELAFLAATLEHQRQAFGEAARRYRALALRWPKAARAPEAHLLAAHDRWEELKSTDDLAPYLELLREHLRQWPESDTTGEARWRLGRAAEHARDWTGAIDAYRAVAATHPRAADATLSLVRAYEQILADPERDRAQQQTVVQEGARYLDNLSTSPALRAVPAVRHQAALGAARLWAQLPPDGIPSAIRVLKSYLSNSDLADAQRQAAEDELLLCLIDQLDRDEVARQTARVAALDPEPLYRSLQTLARKQSTAGDAQQRTIAEVIVGVASQTKPTIVQLADDHARQVALWHAQSLALLGRDAEAAALYEELARQWPADPAVVLSQARLTSATDEPAKRELNLRLWRDVERASAKGSSDWLEARYQIARLHHLLGSDEQARKLVRITKLLHPELGSTELRAKFLELEQQLAPSAEPR